MKGKQTIQNVGLPEKQGLYDPKFEKDNCGIGFIANIKGEKSHEIVEKGLLILKNLSHRGATGCDETTGDGAGIMIQIPHEFFKKKCRENKIDLPQEGKYAVGMVFLPRESDEDLECEGIFETILRKEKLKLLGWRDVEVDRNAIGEIAKGSEPLIKQVFIDKEGYTTEEFERKLFIVRKKAEKEVRNSTMHNKGYFYIPSLSSRTIIYKGLLLARQIGSFYKDLEDKDFKSALALIHQRYSTNTFPTWDLAQPFRYLAHNGEINTIMGNRNWMNAREGVLKSDKFKDGLEELFPILTPNCSDSATLDNAFELLISTGKSLTEAMTMLIPQAWNNNELMDKKEKAYYNYHATIMEPWDGPAAIAFTNGVQLGAMLDRNGLRPSRYTITKDGFVILASETGVLETEPSNVEYSGRLEPGKIFMLDLEQGRIVPDDEIKKGLFESYDYEDWLKRNKITMDMIAKPSYLPKGDEDTLLQRQQAFGYTYEDIKIVLAQMAKDGSEPQGSMGDDTPLAVLSKRPQLLYNYFKQ